jgi:hypothetical protein
MRVWGRTYDANGNPTWVAVETSPTGDNTAVVITWLAQVLLLNLNESPFYADWGIPAKQSVIQQVAPDTFVNLTQQRFAPYFASLIITRTNGNPLKYVCQITTLYGAKVEMEIPI